MKCMLLKFDALKKQLQKQYENKNLKKLSCQNLDIFFKNIYDIKVEGIFHKHKNLKKQHTLKERLNKEITVNLDSGEFTVHEL